jgi:hypothetical protein
MAALHGGYHPGLACVKGLTERAYDGRGPSVPALAQTEKPCRG